MRTVTLRLNKHTNRVVVKKTTSNIRLSVVRRSINLRHSGLRGPQGFQGIQGDKGDKGDKGDTGLTGISTFVRVHHGTDPNIARPNSYFVEWVGTVAPVNGTAEDTWIDTA